MKLEGLRVLMTGASSGIGRASAVMLARRGAVMKLTGRDAAALAEVARATHGEALAVDLSVPGDLARLAQWAADADVLVNNAGAGWAGDFAAMDPALVDELVALNLTAPLHLTRALVPGMVARGRGRVVNVASIAAHVGVRGEAVYCATKWGLLGLSESLRSELAAAGVGVSVVSPGAVATPFFHRRGRPYDRGFPRAVSADDVARGVVRAIERDLDDVFVPGWLTIPARLRGAFPGLYRALAGRFE